ncbi:unnamed protein product [Ascophyllum nodosum]
MVDVSGLVGALGQNDVDQRAVADHLVLLAKVLKNSTALAAALEPQSASTPDISVPKPPKVAKSTKPDEEQARAEDAPVQQAVAMGEHNPEAKKQESILEGQWPDVEEGNAQDHPRHESSEPRRPSEEEGVKSKPTSKLELLVELLRSFRGGMLRVDSNLRAAMFRAVRYLVRTSEDVEVIRRQRFGLFIALALARDNTKLWERMQALKLVKQIMLVDSSKLPREVVRTVVAVSGHKEDNFRRVCLETLCDLAVADPRMVAHANGFRVLLSAATDPANQDLADPLVTTLMSIVEDPNTRLYVRPHLELHQLLSGFTDLDAPPGPERAHRWKATRKALVVAMRSWAGVHLLASDSRGLVALMRLLRDPSAFNEEAELQDSILDTIVDMFDPVMGMGKTSSSTNSAHNPRRGSFVDKLFTPFSGNTATVAQKGTCSSLSTRGLRTRKGSQAHSLLLSYATILCTAFVHCGLIPSLTTLSISAGSEELRAKAATLLVDVLRLCAMLLSQNQCTRLLSMPGLVQIAAEVETGSMAATQGGARFCHLTRSRASRASDLVRLLHRALGTGSSGLMSFYLGPHQQVDPSTVTVGELLHKVVYDAEFTCHNPDTYRSTGWEPTGTLEQMRKDLRLNIESSVEKSVMDNQITKSKVLATKDWTKWDWDVVGDIVQDTLPHPPRLVDALRTKWIKRVSGFYRFVGAGTIGAPTDSRGGGGGLHNMRWDLENIHHIGCVGRLYSLLLQQPEGVHFLQSDARGGLIQEIVTEIESDPTPRETHSAIFCLPREQKFFDMESCQRRLSAGYLTLLFSVAATNDAGRELLVDGGLWDNLTIMGSQPELDYMSRIVLTKMDLISGTNNPRQLLKAWLSTGSSQLRLFAVNLLRSALKRLTLTSLVSVDSSTSTTSARVGSTSSEDSRPEDWCIEALVDQLIGDDPTVASVALSVLEEAIQDERCLRSLVALAKPELINKPGASNLFMRFLSIPEGIQYLENLGRVERMVREWKVKGLTTSYSASVDATWKAHVNEAGYVEESRDLETMSERRGGGGSGSARSEGVEGLSIPIKTNIIQDCLGPWDGREMQLLMGLPWNVEVIISRDSVPTAGIPLRVDTWVDASPQEGASTKDVSHRTAGAPSATTMVVRGVLVDPDGKPFCHPLEAHVTLHARLCIGACPVDLKGNVQWHPNSLMDKQTAPFGRNRPSRNLRSQWSPQHGRNRTDHSAYGSGSVYRGIPEFTPGREMSEDPSDMEHQLFWSSCRPHQRVGPAPVANSGAESDKFVGRPVVGMHSVSNYPNSLHDEALDAEDRDALAPSGHEYGHGHRHGHVRRHRGGVREDCDPLGSSIRSDAKAPYEGYEHVVRVRNEPARWVFTNQPELEDTVTMQASFGNTSVTYLKAVEITITLKDVGPFAILLPPHLYGELAKTEQGCELLRVHADLKNLLHVVRNPRAPADERKGALWAVAHVSSWPLGLTLLEQIQEGVVSMLLSLCTTESHLSVWGTSFCVVSLVARTARGRAAIKAAGWESARDPNTSIFLPQDPTVLFQPVPWSFEGSVAQGLEEQPIDPVIERLRQDLPVSASGAEVLKQVAKLSSHISRKDAVRTLNRMRKDKTHRDCFTNSLPVFLLVHQLLADYRFSLTTRRYIFELFDQVATGINDWEPYIV